MASSILSKFLQWSKFLGIVSKEKGIMPFSPQYWYKSQKYVISQIVSEIEKQSEVRDFLILKGRQQGITTVLHAFDLYWLMANKGIKTGFLCHSYEARPKLREILRQMYLCLPKNMKIPCLIDNRELMHFSNGSEMQFMHISSRQSSKQTVARSQALTCLHATEAAFYSVNDPADEVLKSLLISLSKTHPARYCILESTANGFNTFYDRWQEAKKNPSQKTIFIGWYMRDDYRIPKSNPLFQQYGYHMTREEKSKVKLVKELYGVDITIEQLAWFRKELATTFANDMNYALQELPFTEDDAFRLSGYKFFQPEILTELYKKLKSYKPLYFYVYATKEGIYIEKGNANYHNLKIFEFPKENENYFIGADPSYASSPESDNAVISIWKGYKNKIVQVAEFCDNSVGVVEFAKLCLFFGAFYKNAKVNLEVQGPGRMVLKEIDNFKANLQDFGEIKWNDDNKEYDINSVKENIKYIREYLYYRADSLRKSYVRHWQTTASTKEELLEGFKSYVGLNQVEIKSIDLVNEMSFFIRDGSHLGAEAGKHDDRVIAAAIAVEYWRRYWYHKLPEEKEPVNIEESREMMKKVGFYDIFKPFVEGHKR